MEGQNVTWRTITSYSQSMIIRGDHGESNLLPFSALKVAKRWFPRFVSTIACGVTRTNEIKLNVKDGLFILLIGTIWWVQFLDIYHIIWLELVGPYHLAHIILTMWYGPYDMDHVIWTIWYGQYDMDHIIWTIWYGLYDMDHKIWTMVLSLYLLYLTIIIKTI